MFNIKLPVSGHYKLETRNTFTGEITRTVEFDNIVTNSGLDQIGGYGIKGVGPSGQPTLFMVCCLGTGTTPESALDTTLDQLFTHSDRNVANYTTDFVDEQTGPPYVPAYWYVIRKWRFQAGTFNNTNLSEVGTSDYPTPANYAADYTLFSRSLIKDGNGNPTTITVLSNEILDVTYELRVYLDKTQYPFTFVSGITTYSGQKGVYDISNSPTLDKYYKDGPYAGTIFVVDNPPIDTTAYGNAGAGMSAGVGWTSDLYQSGSYQNTFRATIPLLAGNFDARAIAIRGPRVKYRWILDPPGLQKTDTEKLDIGIQISWGRYTP